MTAAGRSEATPVALPFFAAGNRASRLEAPDECRLVRGARHATAAVDAHVDRLKGAVRRVVTPSLNSDDDNLFHEDAGGRRPPSGRRFAAASDVAPEAEPPLTSTGSVNRKM